MSELIIFQIMSYSCGWFFLWAIFVFRAVICQNHGRTYAEEMTTECETPNYDLGICIDIKKCPILLNQAINGKAFSFLRASECGSKGASNIVYVCCGRYGDFRLPSVNREKAGVSRKSCGHQEPQSHGNKIIGGREAFVGEFPWMAVLIHRKRFGDNIIGCAGFLIHQRYVLTAAHCTHTNIINHKGPIFSILLGEHNLENFQNAQNIRIQEVITHLEYNPRNTGQYNDIAIIQLRENVRFTEYVQPICLVENDNQFPQKYFLSGWGRTGNDSHSKIKMVVQVPFFDKAECDRKFSLGNIRLTETQICAGGEEAKDSCTGDSGGPLMMVTDNETWFAFGIVSFGVGCGTRGWPGVYTNIAKFLPWIRSQMEE